MLDPVALDYIDLVTPYLKFVKNWQLHYCIIPRKCTLTDKIIWLKDCYVGIRTISINNREYSSFTEKYSEKYYIDKNEFIIWKLKN